MPMTAEKNCEQPGVGPGIEAHEHDLIHDLGRRLGCLWAYDRCVANADGRPALQEFWRSAKLREQRNIDRLKQLIKQYVQDNSS